MDDAAATPAALPEEQDGDDAAVEEYRAPSRRSWALAAVVTMAAALVPAVLWAGDISWINDEPRLIAKAYHANREFRLETKGLSGNFGIPYGPLPTHIYQL